MEICNAATGTPAAATQLPYISVCVAADLPAKPRPAECSKIIPARRIYQGNLNDNLSLPPVAFRSRRFF